MSETTLEQIKQLSTQLSGPEKARLVEWLEETLDAERAAPSPKTSRRSLYGLCADLGPGPTNADIEDVRRDMWANFPREGIA